MKKFILLLIVFPIYLFSGVFEHLLNQDLDYLHKHNFRCNKSTCITRENNVFDNEIMDNSVKIVKAFLDHKKKVFKIHVELLIFEEESEAFYSAIIKTSNRSGLISYAHKEVNDKYANHSFIEIIDNQREKVYMDYLKDMYLKAMQSYKN